MWEEILTLKEAYKDGEWIVGGDFNAVKDRKERKGKVGTVNSREVELFADFIDRSSLVDVPCKGQKYTWFSGDGKVKSRIDRFLLSSVIVNRWEVVGQLIGDRDISDHFPIWIKTDVANWGPKPFKFNNEWFSLDSFIPFVEGRGDFVLKEKLRLLKDKLKVWNKEVFGRIELELEECVHDINLADDRLDTNSSSSFLANFEMRKEANGNFWKNLRIKENMFIQKSRIKWLKEGDANSGFFHKVMKQRRRQNHLGPINTPGEEVKEEVWNHFGNKFIETEEVRPLLDGIFFNSISVEEAVDLEKPFLEGEIKEAVWECRVDKSPGPDGPICLVGCLYKAAAKLLAGRLKRVLNSIISPCQSAFVPGRQLLDGVLVANEVVDYARKEGKNCMLFKVDFEKAYDKEFVVNRGLRQGDPLSPFLFVVVAEGLAGLVRKSIELGEFNSFDIKGCKVDLLQFADDTLLVGDGSWRHGWAVKAVLRAFEIVSGLDINYHKSKLIGINSNCYFLEAVSHLFSSRMEDSNFYFLGIPIGFNPRKESTWTPLVLRLKKRLDGWSNRFLNLGGRITLLKSVLSSLAIFTLSFYKAPSTIVNKFKSIQTLLNKWRRGILQGQNSLWFDVLKSRYGDLSSKVFCVEKDHKIPSSCSFWWKDLLKIGALSLLDPVVEKCSFTIHDGYKTPFWEARWLEDIVLKDHFPELYKASSLKHVSVAAMGGLREGIWYWSNLGISVDLLGNGGLRELLGAVKERLDGFVGWKEGKDLVTWHDNLSPIFSVASCYNFYESLCIPLGPNNKCDEAFGLLWKMDVPFKIKAFGWRLFLNKLPTKDLLANRGISLSYNDLLCILCGCGMEDRNHFFFSCPVVKRVWREMAIWVGKKENREEGCLANFMDWYYYFEGNKVRHKKEGIVWLATTWYMWILRNGVCFRKDKWSVNNVVWNIKTLVWKWSFCGNITHPNYMFYEFNMDPLLFIS
ncbi:uncharacterized protein LOC131597964 [Vicia villosa]|uniref:uncharacterized protein LOC131597964 n=1 Tax=Vicia villosa TaxID=3911 RepID=UPI00273A7546|nr:uncharacterized protein LOC131597964 [Vicia villosa]